MTKFAELLSVNLNVRGALGSFLRMHTALLVLRAALPCACRFPYPPDDIGAVGALSHLLTFTLSLY